jgi:hypothetical protein
VLDERNPDVREVLKYNHQRFEFHRPGEFVLTNRSPHELRRTMLEGDWWLGD